MNHLIPRDLVASWVVFLVALPLSLGIAVASGAPVQAGLVAAAVGGIVVGFFGGAPLQVSGPAAGMIVMVFSLIQQYGLNGMAIIVTTAGLLQMILGTVRIASAALIISPAVLQAMLAGIGVLIVAGQFQVVLGGNPHGSFWANLQSLPENLAHLNWSALMVGLITLAVLMLWPRLARGRLGAIPGPLMAIAAGTVVARFMPGPVPYVALGEGFFAGFGWPSLSAVPVWELLPAALAVTVVASAESLLCAVATDRLHNGPPAKLDRELFAQGLGNAISGLLGGLPITGVVVRTSANIAAGGQSRWSAILHGFWIGIFAWFGQSLLTKLPLSALAALLIYVGLRLVRINEIRKIAAFNEAIIYGTTLFGVVFINLLWGIALGLTMSMLLLLKRIALADIEILRHGEELEVRISGSLNFLSVPSLTRALRHLPTGKVIRLSLEIENIDYAAIEAIRGWQQNYENSGGKVVKESLERLWQRLQRQGSMQSATTSPH